MNEKQLFIFDENTAWGAALSKHLTALVSGAAEDALRAAQPKYMEDAADILFSAVGPGKKNLIHAVESWIESQTVAAYHGSRLDSSELQSIRENGLVTLLPSDPPGSSRKEIVDAFAVGNG